jgi:CarD family transcriptional regulator
MAEKSNQAAIGDGSLHVGDRVVYPNQGICRITGVAEKTISGMSIEMVTLSREEDGATVMVPRAKVMGIGLRKVADVAAIDKVFDELASPGNDPQLDWKVRHRENAERMSGGGLFGTVEVLKGLHALSRVRPLPAKERELYDQARHLLVGEIAAAMNIPLHVAEDNLDYALWPPQGMKRKGRELPPATLGPPAPLRAAGEDADDLGFEDEEAEEKQPAPAEPEAAETNDEEAPKPAPAAAKKPAAPKAAKHEAAKHAPEPKHEAPKHEALKHEAPKHEAPKHEAAKHEALKHESPKHESPRHAPEPKHEAPKHEAPKHEAPKHAPEPKHTPTSVKKAAPAHAHHAPAHAHHTPASTKKAAPAAKKAAAPAAKKPAAAKKAAPAKHAAAKPKPKGKK